MDNTNQTQTKTDAPVKTASATLKVIAEGSNKKLLNLIPKGQSPKLYLDLIKAQVMGVDKAGKARNDDDLLMFLYVCKRVGLDPLTKQIYAVFRWDYSIGREKMSIQTGIDGMRLVAQRTGDYAGQDDIKYTPEDESTNYPTKATCTVYKMIKGNKVAFTASARWSEYAQLKDGKPLSMWAKMPYNQLGKCAEALALRKGFPNELSGIYSAEEMAQTANVLTDLPAPVKPEVMHGAPTDMPKDNAIGSAEAKAVTEAVKPKVVYTTKTEVKTAMSDLRAKIQETRAKSAKEGQPVLKVATTK